MFESLHLYRNLLRALLKFPKEHLHAKLHYNIKETFLFYRNVNDKKFIEYLQKNGKEFENLLKEWSKLPRSDLDILFQTLPNNTKNPINIS